MTQHEFMLYLRLFDALRGLRAIDKNASIQVHGNVAGAALRTWAAAEKLDVVPETREMPDMGTWTTLVLTLPGEITWMVIAHLEDHQSLTAPVEPTDDTEIPF